MTSPRTPPALNRTAARPSRAGVGLPPPAPISDAAALKLAAEKLKAMAKTLRPHELVAMLASHYARARVRERPRVTVTLQVSGLAGRPAVVMELG